MIYLSNNDLFYASINSMIANAQDDLLYQFSIKENEVYLTYSSNNKKIVLNSILYGSHIATFKVSLLKYKSSIKMTYFNQWTCRDMINEMMSPLKCRYIFSSQESGGLIINTTDYNTFMKKIPYHNKSCLHLLDGEKEIFDILE